jgi:nitrate reductase assembly molybdenum cofactor insertion protein NarJ
MPAVNVGNIRITTTFKTQIRYTKTGEMRRDTYMYTSYRNTATGKTATTAELKAAGIKRRQAPSVKLTPENADFLFNKAMRAEAGEISGRNFANVLGSKTYSMPTSKQQQQFKDALKDMFKSSNPSAEELQEWNDMIDRMTPEEAQEFYERYHRDLSPGFKGYHSHWSTTDSDPMGRYTGADQGLAARQKANRDEMRPRLLNAAGTFLRDKGKLQTTLNAFA